MAKGNLLLGTAGNSVGDVVMYRREGAQVSRVRVRKIKNPKTDAQSLQRAAFSPVAKFYSPLAVVLERSFEGLSKMKSYNKFLKTNIDLARANGWLLPKGTGFFPLPYKLSQGTLPTINYTGATAGCTIYLPGVSGDDTTVGEFSTALIAAGYQAGDIITFIFVCKDEANNMIPTWAQMEVDVTSTVTIVNFFKPANVAWAPGGSTTNFKVVASRGTVQACAVIVARFENDKWRRSTQSLSVDSALLSSTVNDATYKAAAIASYGMNAGDPNPLVYLDGDTLEG